MTKKIVLLLVFLVFGITILSACTEKGVETKKIGDIKIEIVDPDTITEDLQKWYRESYKEKFSHSVSYIDGYKYVLICAGEMPTAGYEISITDAKKENDIIVFYAKLLAPEEEDLTAQVITYPHTLFRVKEKGELSIRAELDMGGIEYNQGSVSDQYKELQGIYVGMADSNSIEIKVDPSYEFPGNGQTVVFKLADTVLPYFLKDNPEYKEFKNDDPVEFDCLRTNEGMWEITKIEHIADKVQDEKITGEYIGQADANSVEIKIDGSPEIFRLADHIKSDMEFSDIETGTKVMIEYVQEAGIRTITSIEPVANG